MYLRIDGTTGLTVNDWILAGLSLNDFYNDSRRGDISIARRGKDGNTIIDVRSIRRPERIAAIEAKFGPIEQSEQAALYQAKPDTEARVFYTAYRKADGTPLEARLIEQYTNRASLLEALKRGLETQRAERARVGKKVKMGEWYQEAMAWYNGQREQYPCAEISNARSFERVFKAYCNEGYSSIVSKAIGNDNSRKVSVKTENLIVALWRTNGKPFKDTYLASMHRELSNVMTFCMKYYGLTMNPCRLVGPMGKYEAEEMKIWTKDQFEIYLAHEDKRPYHVAFNVLFYSGLREGELLALTPRDLLDKTYALDVRKNFANVEGKDIFLTPKTESGRRIVTLPKSVYEELKQYVKDIDCAPDQRIFYFKRAGLWNEFRNCTSRAQLPPIRIHDIRHSHVSMLIDMGFNVKQIADRVGHKNAATTMKTYSHLYAGRDIELAKRLDEQINSINEDVSGEP